jgi:hypothetical protein
MDWKFILKGMAIIFIMCLLLSIEARADTTSSGASDLNQTNQSGTNTSISGGYSQESTTTYQSGSSSNTTTNNETNNSTNQKTAVNSANAPAMSSYGQDSCLIPITGSTSTISLGIAIGTYVEDKECSVRKTAKLLKQMGLSIASISLLCEEMPMVKNALRISGTPCPVLHNGKSYIGEEAIKILNMKDKNKTKVDSKPSMTWNKND